MSHNKTIRLELFNNILLTIIFRRREIDYIYTARILVPVVRMRGRPNGFGHNTEQIDVKTQETILCSLCNIITCHDGNGKSAHGISSTVS